MIEMQPNANTSKSKCEPRQVVKVTRSSQTTGMITNIISRTLPNLIRNKREATHVQKHGQYAWQNVKLYPANSLRQKAKPRNRVEKIYRNVLGLGRKKDEA